MKNEEKELKTKTKRTKNKNTSTGYKVRWKLKEACKWKREDKSVIISRKCSLKTKTTSEDKKMKMKEIE